MSQYDKLSDSELVLLLITGNEQAFRVIYQKYIQILFRYARKNIAVQEDCEEIIQEVFESFWARREKLQHVARQENYLHGYLINSVRYKVIRYFHNNKRKVKYADHFRLFEAVYDNTQEGERDFDALQSLITQKLSKLPERCQQAFKMRLIENLSNTEIAVRMKVKKGTVENYMITALKHLRAWAKSADMARSD